MFVKMQLLLTVVFFCTRYHYRYFFAHLKLVCKFEATIARINLHKEENHSSCGKFCGLVKSRYFRRTNSHTVSFQTRRDIFKCFSSSSDMKYIGFVSPIVVCFKKWESCIGVGLNVFCCTNFYG